MSNEPNQSRQSAIEAGEQLLAILRNHIGLVAAGDGADDEAEEVDRQLWDAVGAYGDALDELYDEAEEPDDEAEAGELTFTVRARYDYTVIDEKAVLSRDGGIAAVVGELLQKSKPFAGLDIAALEKGSGLVTVHLGGEPLTASDFDDAEESSDLLLVAPDETLALVLNEPVYESRAEAEAAAKRG